MTSQLEQILEIVAKYVGKTSGIYRYIAEDLVKLKPPANKPIKELMEQYTEECCDFRDSQWVREAALRYVETMQDSQVRCLLYALATADPFQLHFPEGIQTNTFYKVLCDDKGRNGGSWLSVMIANDSDVHVGMQDWEEAPEGMPTPFPSVRCRTYFGGGRNGRVHQALLNLAKAIQLDNEENGR